MQNKTINGHTLLNKLGEGGMAEVWYAKNSIGKEAAIKILKRELSLMNEVVSRFENEARVMVKLNHPNIRQVYDYATIDQRPCIIMEYLEGADLSHRLKQGERFSNDQLIRWWDQMVEALQYTHSKDIIHRDIKPSNIFITTNGNVKLLDFGIAKINDSITVTQTGTRMGTLMYMSPEQIKDSKHLDYRTDLYSLAVTFYHLITGAVPYDNTSSSEFEIQTKIVTEPLRMDELPNNWNQLLSGYLYKDPLKRKALHSFREEKTIIENFHAINNQPDKTILEDYHPEINSTQGTFTDQRDGHVYKWVKIGNQTWMAENLAYLPSVSPPSEGSDTEKHYYVYGYNSTNIKEAKATVNYATYGVLYNWPAAMDACPEGWHLPSDEEWTELSDYLGGESVAGGKLKEKGITHWISPNTGACNKFGFTALPAGYRYKHLVKFRYVGKYDYVGKYGYWWSSNSAYRRHLGYIYEALGRKYGSQEYGFSVRLVRD